MTTVQTSTPAASDAEDVFVRLRDLTVAYGSGDGAVYAVDRTTLNIKSGEFVAIVGPSGCGKSTLLKVVSGLTPAAAGRVEVDGEEVTAPLKIVGMAFQSATMLPWRRTIDNILLPLQIVEPHRRRFRRDRAENLARANALLKRVGLADAGDKYPWQLSGGMLQRASLCRALIHAPQLLLLDEPFGALDAFTREELWRVLQNLWLDSAPTVLLVTHDLREAVFLADRIVVMSPRPGRILHEERVPFARPRRLADLFSPEAGQLMQRLREKIDHRSLLDDEEGEGA